ncbi:hypothetical protein [Candidatus Mycoplasma haematominutum]|uniref:hypothetical protein n=1 Tax=Candidatus Mycoplasma haematominutum TaxID=209446 RepID=UPI0002E257D3|nr:hypothetical protein [Candidatus Mycoplasma haematominutum]
MQTSTQEFKTQLEEQFKNYHSQLKNTVSSETQKLEDALKKLQDSNTQLIQRVKLCIEKMPESIFEEIPQGKDWCTHLHEKQQKASS